MNLFQERFRELPAFQKALELVSEYDGGFYSKEEFVTRILMLNEDALNWDTLCKNCGVLMDDNYAKYLEIERLKEQLNPPVKSRFCDRCPTNDPLQHFSHEDF